jgi:hypothetical protein
MPSSYRRQDRISASVAIGVSAVEGGGGGGVGALDLNLFFICLEKGGVIFTCIIPIFF